MTRLTVIFTADRPSEALPDKPVRALEETASGIRCLFAGARVATTGDRGRLRARLYEKLYRALRPGVFVFGAYPTARHR